MVARIMPRPSTRVVRWSARMFGDDVAERVFAPMVADWARELQEARTERACLRAWVAGATAVVSCATVVGLRLARPVRSDWPVFGRGLLTAAAFVAVGCGGLFMPFFTWWADRGWAFVPLAFALLPAMIALSLPFALLPGALALGSRATTTGTWRPRAAVGAAVLVATCALAAVQTWVVPATASRFQPMMRAKPSRPAR